MNINHLSQFINPSPLPRQGNAGEGSGSLVFGEQLSAPFQPYQVSTQFRNEYLQALMDQAPTTNIIYLKKKLSVSSDHIQRSVIIDRRIKHGNPVFAGTRIPIYQILEELSEGTKLEDLPECYPSLTLELISAGLDFAISLMRIYDD